ncbi:glycosyltransferase [Corynebacterium lowii]|uniref:UDP-Gal:alpha-D-GlcNAc-diphosphoundecaprenol beta-1,3-galactosyltransferase n=1 Tax=Corynebacterium lowii TaxID=1544413 RepID=A0A0Q0ULK8_9CORY|nr:glycosyltransferase [Corynebacterium lowii]KQB87263.1 UDP-Gal:alpha-D-GlcNAc-diphosphoundecaprenol beta-1,3-galactosyltransferase [Corynebacterium lowii]MDP9852150.1 glycosyltransferase involved in cell wall biosynthesis [Corynebacterium lowii]
MSTLGVLITVYHGSQPAHLAECLDSLAAQTRQADHIVLVEDGPVSAQVHALIDAFTAQHPHAEVLRLPHNMGSGLASAAGLERMEGDELIARLDSDDIAAPERFERQCAFLTQHPEIDILGTALAEFERSPEEVTAIRRLPEQHHEIARYAKMNSPINNPSVMMRAAALHTAGGYRHVHFMEDYDLYARALATGARFHNLPEPLTYFRVSDAQFARRTGSEMFAAERQMQRHLVSYGLISKPRSWFNLAARTTYRLLPQDLLRRAYARLFHRKPKKD